ncbi:FCD domain-containing protein [bacterium]|nr:FCD domain-containing protein [bacterium]
MESRPKTGTRVRARHDWNLLDPDVLAWQLAAGPVDRFVRDLMELRQIIEPQAAAIAARQAKAPEIRAIEDAYRQMEKSADRPEHWAEHDIRFHRAILLATGNELLSALAATIEAALAAWSAVANLTFVEVPDAGEAFIWYQIGPNQWLHQYSVSMFKALTTLPGGVDTEIWFAIDLYEQNITLYRGLTPLFVTLVGTGLPRWPTYEGLFHIYYRSERENMSWGAVGDDYYLLEEVPWTMYFDEGRALHGAYWHNSFGYRAQSWLRQHEHHGRALYVSAGGDASGRGGNGDHRRPGGVCVQQRRLHQQVAVATTTFQSSITHSRPIHLCA